MQVERVRSRNVVTTTPSASLQEAAQLMRHYHVGALVVVDDETGSRRAVGIVTDRDLVLQAMANGVGPRDASVADVMTEGLASIASDASVFEAIDTMREHGVRRLAVSDGAGALCGIVSLDDVVAALGAELGSLAGVLTTELEAERDVGQRAPVMMAIG